MRLKLQIKNYRCFSDQHPARFEIRKGIQAIVGPNNSGKSSLLKVFYDFRSLFSQLGQPTMVWQSIGPRAIPLNFNYPESVGDRNELFFDGNSRDLEILIDIEYMDQQRATFSILPSRVILTVPRGQNHSRLSLDTEGGLPSGALELKENRYLHAVDGGARVLDLQPISMLSEFLVSTLYVSAFRNAINVGQHAKYFDIQVGQLFTTAWKYFKSGATKSGSEACRRLERQIAEIFGYEDLQINPLANDKELHVIADGKSYKASDMGAGLLQFVIVLANAAITSPRFILIDEPESNLHPMLQLSFLTTLASYARDGVFLSTHSVGLARAAAERIYSVRRLSETQDSELRPFEGTHNLGELLGELGFNAYYDLGFSKVLLVEGPSDVKVIQQFLRCLRKEREVLLLPLGGAGMINGNIDIALEEIKRIGARVSALIDSERSQSRAGIPRDRQKFSEKCRQAGIRCCILERRAVENYLTERAVRKVKGDKYSGLAPYEKLEKLALPWGKEENWLIAREMDRVELVDTDLGRFLESL